MDPNENEAPKSALEAVMGVVPVAEEEAPVAAEPEPDKEGEQEQEGQEAQEEQESQEGEQAEAEPPELTEAQKADEAEMKALGIEKPDSRARFQELANSAREGREYKARWEKQQAVFDHMEQGGITGEQFGLMTAIAADVNSGDPVRLERAHQALLAQVTFLAKALGKEAPGFDPLSAHPDLRTKVEEEGLDRAVALEVAASRHKAQVGQQYQQRRDDASSYEGEVASARDALNALEAQLKTQDPHYTAKRATTLAILQPQLAGIPPSKWAETYARVYATVPTPVATPPVKKPAPDNAGRPNGKAGAPEPKTAQEAVLAAMGFKPE